MVVYMAIRLTWVERTQTEVGCEQKRAALT